MSDLVTCPVCMGMGLAIKPDVEKIIAAEKRIEELEAHRDRLIERLECRNCTELQRKYEALVGKIRGEMEEYENSYEPETIALIDNISALLEDDDKELDGTMECHLAMKNAGLL